MAMHKFPFFIPRPKAARVPNHARTKPLGPAVLETRDRCQQHWNFKLEYLIDLSESSSLNWLHSQEEQTVEVLSKKLEERGVDAEALIEDIVTEGSSENGAAVGVGSWLNGSVPGGSSAVPKCCSWTMILISSALPS
jgi:hypothetical protein